jgi:hypothetical protein
MVNGKIYLDTQHLIRLYPHVYHMAEKDTWQSIKSIGLLSTSAALDRYKVQGSARIALEQKHRPEKISVGNARDQIVLRDQGPMAPSRLAMALPPAVTPSKWYRFLNGLVFMWAEETRLLGLLNARRYRNLEHDVLTIDLRSFVTAYEESIWLCHMNSGNTFPVPHKRDLGSFRRIKDYPANRKGNPAKTVVEVVTDYSVPDIGTYVIAVRRMRGAQTIRTIPI